MKLNFVIRFFFLLLSLQCSQGNDKNSSFRGGVVPKTEPTPTLSPKPTIKPEENSVVTVVEATPEIETIIKEASLKNKELKVNSVQLQNNQPIDVIFLLDTSGSMKDVIKKVQENVSKFIADLKGASTDKTLFQIKLVIYKGNIEKFDKIPDIVIEKSETQAGEYMLKDFLDTFLFKPGFLRDASIIEIVVVSDTNSTNLTAEQFKSEVSSKLNNHKLYFHSIVGLTEPTGFSFGKALGQVFIDLSNTLQFKGTVLDLYTSDWGPLLANLAQSIISSNIIRTFTIDDPDIDVTRDVTVEIKQIKLNANQFTFDPLSKVIKINDDVPLKSGEAIGISYFGF